MNLADHYIEATGRWGFFDGRLLTVGEPKGDRHLWQNCTIRSAGNEYSLSVYYNSELPDLEIRQDEAGRDFCFKIKAKRVGNFTNLVGFISGPAKGEQNASTKK